jgi:serine protease inhibitor
MRLLFWYISLVSVLLFDDYGAATPFEGQRQNAFDWRLTCAALSSQNTNALISPVSIKLLLSLLYEAAGTESHTEQQLRVIFDGQMPDVSKLRETFGTIIKAVKTGSPDFTFKLGTKIYTHNGLKPVQKFEALAEEFYDTQIESLNFNDLKGSVGTINRWTEAATGGHVKNLADEGED